MTITISGNTFERCGTAVSAPSDIQGLDIRGNSIINCGQGIVIRDNITDKDLRNLVEKIDNLVLTTEEDKRLASEAKQLLEIEISLPPERKEVAATLRNICESLAASTIFTAITAWANTIPM